MTIDELRPLIAELEALSPRVKCCLEEMEYYAPFVAHKAVVMMEHSDISSPEALLFAALVWQLKETLKYQELALQKAKATSEES